jgi:perosamine synthetase
LADLNARGIQVSNYFPPVHMQPFIAEQYGYTQGDFPIAEFVSQRTLALPFHNNLSEAEVDLVCSELAHALDRLPSRKKTQVR